MEQNFEEIIDEEKKLIAKPPEELVGLALSGGGIRSATFNLGVLQALAELGLLKKFDYLSTVSGGGYIGSWLSALIHRQGDGDVSRIEQKISPRINGKLQPENPAVTFLRNFSNYLTPRTGLFSTDTLAAVTTYLRNLYLNQSVLILALAVLLLVPRLVQGFGKWLKDFEVFSFAEGIVVVLLIASVSMIARNLVYKAQAKSSDPWWTETMGIFWTIVIPTIAAAWLGSLYLLKSADKLKEQFCILVLGTGLLYLLLWAIGYGITLYLAKLEAACASLPPTGHLPTESVPQRRQNLQGAKWLWLTKVTFFTLLAGALGGVLFWILASLVASLVTQPDDSIASWIVTAFGTPLVVMVFSLIVVLHTGLMGRLFTEDQREWWSRLGALLLATMLLWLGIFSIAIFGPPLLIWINDVAGHYVMGLLGSGWLITTIGGVLAGKSPATGGRNPQLWLELLARCAPYIFVTGALMVLSLGIQTVLQALGDASGECPATGREFYPTLQQQLCIMSRGVQPPLLGWIILFLTLIVCFLAQRINVNLFSLHHFYRYRLTRCYLGATKWPHRNAHPFTGFDPDDDLNLSDLTQRPYPIINAAINFTEGGELAWQDRKAASFVFTPKYCGYQIPDPKNWRKNHYYYRPTSEYAMSGYTMKNPLSLSLGTVMAISGAAFSPNMGFHTVPVVAFLLTVFNVRLGRWVGNPKNTETWTRADPKFGLACMLVELFCYSSLDSRYVYLSDGGHFENTGLYELVRRKCRFIVACDAGADPDRTFGDLADAIRKCRTDFGVEITIDLDLLRSNSEKKRSLRHYAEGEIHYPDTPAGKLILLKPSLTGHEPADILSYADSYPDFPQQPTTDQWFDEAQFESYRKLGYYITKLLEENDKWAKFFVI